jgi:hypothetical protein
MGWVSHLSFHGYKKALVEAIHAACKDREELEQHYNHEKFVLQALA